MLPTDNIANAQVAKLAQREPEIGRPITRFRQNVAREATLLDMLEQIVNRVCGDYAEKATDPAKPPRLDNLVGTLDNIADGMEDNLERLGALIERLSSQV